MNKQHDFNCLGFICTCGVSNILDMAKEIAEKQETSEFYQQQQDDYNHIKTNRKPANRKETHG